MKLKLGQLINANQTLGKLNGTHGLTATCAFSIAKNIKKITQELEIYEETRKKILEEKADKDSEGKAIIEEGNYKLSSNVMNEVLEEINQLQQNEVDLDLSKIQIEDLNSADLTPQELFAIEFMVKE